MLKRGQVMLEYLLLLTIVAVVVLSSFRSSGVVSQSVDSINAYYKVGATAILGGRYDAGGAVIMEDPVPVAGGWCAWSACIRNHRVRECACPRPAFGGAECPNDASGAAVAACS